MTIKTSDRVTVQCEARQVLGGDWFLLRRVHGGTGHVGSEYVPILSIQDTGDDVIFDLGLRGEVTTSRRNLVTVRRERDLA